MGMCCWPREILKYGKISGDLRMAKSLFPDKMVFLPVLLLFFVLFFSKAIGSSSSNELENFLQEIQGSSDRVHSFTSGFTQEKILSLFSNPVIFQGRLSIVRPDRLRWEFTSPVPSVLILDGEQGVRCNDKAEAEKFRLSSDPVMKIVAEQLWFWLGGDYKELARHHRLDKRDPATLLITPEDQSTADYVETVTIIFDENSLQPLQVEIMEPGGDRTRISFHSSSINMQISEKLFTDCMSDE